MKRLILIAMVVLLSAPSVMAQCDWDYFYPNCKADLDHDCDIDAIDVVEFLNEFGRNVFFLPCPPNGPALVEKTGQTTSYATGDDGELESGIAWPNQRFNDRGNGTVVDNLTGLTWLKEANCFGQRTWNNALSDSNGLSSGQCGLTDGSTAGDWRLPNIKELHSLVNYEKVNPALPLEHPFINVQCVDNKTTFNYWSSSTVANVHTYAWTLFTHSGDVMGYSKSNDYFVWPVRGGH